MSGPQNTSMTLLRRMQGREADAWARFEFLYRPLIAHWCRRWSLGPADTDDVIQEVLKAVLTHLGEFERLGERGSFRAWLRGVTRNKLLEQARHRQTRPAAPGGTDAHRHLQAVPDPTAELEESPEELAGLYLRAAEAIRGDFEPQTWDIFWRIVVDGQPPAEVAAALGLKSPAVRMAKARVLKRLRDELGDFADPPE